MSQETQIFTFLLNNPNVKPKEIADALGFPRPSVRRVLFTFRKKMIVSKPRKNLTSNILKTTKAIEFEEDIEFEEKEEEEEIEDFYVKTLKTSGYRKNLVASTWEETKGGKESRFKELKKRMEEFAQIKKISIDDLGYSNVLQHTEPIIAPEFDLLRRAEMANGNFRLGIEVHTE